jgi:O-antigen/teichoic acid export membrane protein
VERLPTQVDALSPPALGWSTFTDNHSQGRARTLVTTVALARRALHGLIWMLAQNVVARACGLASQLALAALLAAADFGVISITYTITGIISTLLNIGIDDVLLQRHRGLRHWTGPAFWINISVASIAAALAVGISPFAAAVYEAPDLIGLVAILAVAMPVSALASVPVLIMRSRMRFGVIALYGTLEIVAQAVSTIGLAWAGFGVYSFVVPVPFLAAIKAVAWWRLAGSKPSFRPRVRRWKYVMNNIAAMFTTRLLIALVDQGDYLVLGLIASKDVVGAYYFGFRLAAQPLWTLAGNFSGVLFPALVHLKADPVRQGDAALNASTLLSYCIMPLAAIQAGVAAPLVRSLFGDKWAASIPVIQILSVGLAFDGVSWLAGALLSARREFSVTLRYVVLQTPVFFVMVTIGGMLDQAVGVAWAVCLFYVITQPIFICAAYKRIGVKRRQVAAIYLRPTAYAALAVGLGRGLSLLPPFAAHAPAQIAVVCLFAAPTYAALVRWLEPAIWLQLLDRIRSAVHKRVTV